MAHNSYRTNPSGEDLGEVFFGAEAETAQSQRLDSMQLLPAEGTPVDDDDDDEVGELTKNDLEIARTEVNKRDFALSPKEKCYAWTVAVILLMDFISGIWQRLLISAYEVEPGPGKDTPKYEMKLAIPNFGEVKYSLLAGAAFTVFYATASLFTGVLADTVSRKWLLGLCSVFWSLTSIGSGFSTRFWELCVMRVGLGLFSSCLNPAMFSLVADFFPPEDRTLANSVVNCGKYLGTAAQSLTIILIGAVGWRASYEIVGFLGVFIGLLTIVAVREPPRGAFDPAKIKENLQEDEREVEVKPEKDDGSLRLNPSGNVGDGRQPAATEFELGESVDVVE